MHQGLKIKERAAISNITLNQYNFCKVEPYCIYHDVLFNKPTADIPTNL